MLLILGFAACTEEGALHQQEQGYLSLGSVMVDVTTENDYMTRTLTSDPQAPSASDFLVELIDSYGTVIKQGKPQDFTSPLLLFVTTYTIRASYGDAESLISNKPYYYGETTVTVKANETTFAAPISASLQSAMVSADVSALSTHFTTNPKVYLSTSSTKVELRSGSWLYLKPEHNYIMTLEGTNQAGIAVNPTLKSWNPVKKTAYTITATPDLPILTLPNQQAGAWAKRLYITPATATNALGNAITLPKGLVYEVIPASSSDWSAALTSSTDVNGLQVIKGLNSNTRYKIRARVGLITSEQQTITTEQEVQLSDSKMDEWITENSHSLKSGFLASKKTYYAYKPTSGIWATTNAKTFDRGGTYTCNAYPSVVYETNDNGKAAAISTIGWTDGATNTNTICYDRSAGRLFTGSYTYNTYTYGTPCESRPSAISFDCKYDSYNNDMFKVWAIVEFRNDTSVIELAKKELVSGSLNSYANLKLSLEDVFTDFYLHATHITIVFSSTQQCNDNNDTESSNIKNSGVLYYTDNRWKGSTLYIDNISLIYE